MNSPNIEALMVWVDGELIEKTDRKRKAKGEILRDRKLGTREMLWLMLSVALNTANQSLHEILRLTISQTEASWDVSVPAFCKARNFFLFATSTSFTASWF